MTEPVCQFCGVTDEQKCKSGEDAFNCQNYHNKMKLDASVKKAIQPTKNTGIKMSKTTEQLAELSGRSARSVIAVIDAMAQRGAYKGEELATIGQLRNDCAQLVQLAEAVQSELKSAEEAEAKKK